MVTGTTASGRGTARCDRVVVGESNADWSRVRGAQDQVQAESRYAISASRVRPRCSRAVRELAAHAEDLAAAG